MSLGQFVRLSDGLIAGLDWPNGWDGMWSRGTSRKNAVCLISGAQIQKGEDCYRPVGCNTGKRVQRIHAQCIDKGERCDAS